MKTIIIDFETSGFNPYHDDLIEIGAKVMGSSDPADTFSSLVRPKSEKQLSPRITEVTGITNRELRRFCRSKGWTEGCWFDGCADFYFWIIDVLNGDTEVAIVAHNGTTFDFIFLQQMVRNLQEGGCDIATFDGLTIHYIDTCLLSRRILKNLFCHKQGVLCDRFGIIFDVAHRALADVEALEGVYGCLLQQLSRHNYGTSAEEVVDYISLKV